jgi:hypothetical protein
MAHRMDIIELFDKVEGVKEADPRTKGSVDDLISLYSEIAEIIRAAGWSPLEYEVTVAGAAI